MGIPSAANGLNLVVGEGVKCDTGESCFIFVVGGGLKLVVWRGGNTGLNKVG